MNLKKLSLVCCTASIAIGAFSLPAQAAMKHRFFYGISRQLQYQNSTGAKEALNLFVIMDDKVKDGYFEIGKEACSALKFGFYPQQVVDMIRDAGGKKRTHSAEAEAMYVAVVNAAKATMCPN